MAAAGGGAGGGLKQKAVSAFEWCAVFWCGDDVDEFGSEALAGSAGSQIVWVAGDPEVSEAVGAGEGEEQAAGSFGKVVAAEGGVDVVADVAGVGFDVEVVFSAEADGADGGGGDAQFEMIGGNALVCGVGGTGFGESE